MLCNITTLLQQCHNSIGQKYECVAFSVLPQGIACNVFYGHMHVGDYLNWNFLQDTTEAIVGHCYTLLFALNIYIRLSVQSGDLSRWIQKQRNMTSVAIQREKLEQQ